MEPYCKVLSLYYFRWCCV